MNVVAGQVDGSIRVDPASFVATTAEFDVVVLDVHGVVLNKPLGDFIVDVGERSGEGGVELLARWRRELRVPFWEGRLDEAELWAALAPGRDPAELRDELESRYARGPLYRTVLDGDTRTWLLSNHRSDWLLPRLERFGLAERFQRVLVSDRIGAAKPSPRAFDEVAALGRTSSVCFVDDQTANVDAARACGVAARLLVPGQP